MIVSGVSLGGQTTPLWGPAHNAASQESFDIVVPVYVVSTLTGNTPTSKITFSILYNIYISWNIFFANCSFHVI